MSRSVFVPLGLVAILSTACAPYESADDPGEGAAQVGGGWGDGGSDFQLNQGGSGGGAGSSSSTSSSTTSSGTAGHGAGGEGAGLPDPPVPPPNPFPTDSVCNDPEGHHAYLLNEIFIREGHPFLHVDSGWAELVDKTPGSNHWNPAGWNQPYSTENRCEILINDADSPFFNVCDSNEPGRCHCWDSSNVCRCDKMVREAQKEVCKLIFQNCTGTDPLVTRSNIFFAATVKYLTDGQMQSGQSSIYPAGGTDNVPTTAHAELGPPEEEPPPECMASPLVLDLAGDGVHPSSLREGARFDLMGFGVQNTSWIKGDDGLLTLDRNGNGTIDDGSELFGAGTEVNGRVGCDGFAALTPLDTNGNGRIDGQDTRFGDLRVWRDENGDGLSQPTELCSLADLGIASIGLDHSKFRGEFDRHGNELSMKGTFLRTDGSSGLIVDVYFVTGRADRSVADDR
ncbi:MAG: hypothetical protein JRI68_28030 [Deltaproteobacteria bacterium]|nr:hypothetical protein [Deltaproteobacteria bacterium]